MSIATTTACRSARLTMAGSIVLAFVTALCGWRCAPAVTNITAAQRPGQSRLVDITYNLTDPDSARLLVEVKISSDGGATWRHPHCPHRRRRAERGPGHGQAHRMGRRGGHPGSVRDAVQGHGYSDRERLHGRDDLRDALPASDLAAQPGGYTEGGVGGRLGGRS